jgi:hypothetical protein
MITTTTSDNIVAITITWSNLSTNNYTVFNKSIKRATTDFVYNKESNSASI